MQVALSSSGAAVTRDYEHMLPEDIDDAARIKSSID